MGKIKLGVRISGKKSDPFVAHKSKKLKHTVSYRRVTVSGRLRDFADYHRLDGVVQIHPGRAMLP
jgi:hypothetical protein